MNVEAKRRRDEGRKEGRVRRRTSKEREITKSKKIMI